MSATIWADGFETDHSLEYYERNVPGGSGTWGRSTDAAFTGSWGLKSLAQSAASSNSNWWLGFGKLPVPIGAPYDWPAFAVPAGVDSTSVFTDVTVTFRHMAAAGWVQAGEGALKLFRMSVFSGHKPGDTDGGAQAAALHLWSAGGTDFNDEILQLDPASGVSGSTVVTTGWNDLANLTFLGQQTGTTHIYSDANEGHWFDIKVRWKLNTPGLSDGIMEYWVDGVREINATNLNFIGSYPLTYGINTVHLERFWNSGAPGNNVSYFDDLLVVDNNASGSAAIIVPRSPMSIWNYRR